MRGLGWVGACAGVAAIASFNLGVGHFRDASTASASTLWLADLVRHPFTLSVKSAALVLVGVGVSLTAIVKGFALDDPCPGYGAVDREFRRADHALLKAEIAFRARAIAHVEAVPAALAYIVASGNRGLTNVEEHLVDAIVVSEQYELGREGVERKCHHDLRYYRTMNEAVRTRPAPAYFTAFPTFTSRLDPQILRDLRALVGQAQAVVAEVAGHARALGLLQAQRTASARTRIDLHIRAAYLMADGGQAGPPTDPGSARGPLAAS